MIVPSTFGWSEELMARWEALANELHRRLGPGAPLIPEQRHRMEEHLGYDVSGALLHISPLAGQLASAHVAHAVSTGGHVLGDASRLDGDSVRGQALLGHELTHAVRGLGGVPRPVGAMPGGMQVQLSPAESPQVSSPNNEERLAQTVEARLIQRAPAATTSPATTVDIDRLTERVYQRVLDQLRDERERAAELG
jgi:hypothetical protein